jgi:uncharacterized protein YlxP (DUF503 family)
MFVCALAVELHIPEARSLKAKRAVVKPIVEGARHRFGVAAAEVDHQDLWQRASLGFAVVASSAAHAAAIVDQVDRFVWSHPEVDVVSSERRWLE